MKVNEFTQSSTFKRITLFLFVAFCVHAGMNYWVSRNAIISVYTLEVHTLIERVYGTTFALLLLAAGCYSLMSRHKKPKVHLQTRLNLFGCAQASLWVICGFTIGIATYLIQTGEKSAFFLISASGIMILVTTMYELIFIYFKRLVYFFRKNDFIDILYKFSISAFGLAILILLHKPT